MGDDDGQFVPQTTEGKKKEAARLLFQNLVQKQKKDVSGIADELGVSRQMIWEYRKDPDFWDEFHKYCTDKAQSLIPNALQTLKENMRDGGVAGQRAAETVFKITGMDRKSNQQDSAAQPIQITLNSPPENEKEIEPKENGEGQRMSRTDDGDGKEPRLSRTDDGDD